MKSLILLCLIIACMPAISKAQNDTLPLERGTTYPGYIITSEGDTTQGWLLNINLWLNQHMTFYYNDSANREGRVKYKAKELSGYKVGNRVYESLKFKGLYSNYSVNFFMRVITGPINYYEWYYDPDRSKLSPTNFSLKDISDAILFEENELSTQKLCRKLDGEMVELGQLKYLFNFDKNMSKLVSDYPELAEKIRNKVEGYKWINKKEIIREYNAWYLENH
jgi:hypothetical protein